MIIIAEGAEFARPENNGPRKNQCLKILILKK